MNVGQQCALIKYQFKSAFLNSVWDKLFIWLWSIIIWSKTSLSFSGFLEREKKEGLRQKKLYLLCCFSNSNFSLFFLLQLALLTATDRESLMEGKVYVVIIWFIRWLVSLCVSWKQYWYNRISLQRPGLLGSNMGTYPWLADSWPTPNLTHNSKDSVNCCSGKLDSERYYNSKSSLK